MAVSIKSQKEIELMRESCRLLSIVHDEMGKAIKPGISTYEINKIGRVGVKAQYGFDSSIVPSVQMSKMIGTVASLRADCVISFALRISREKAASLIRQLGISVNHMISYKADTILNESDVFSVKGHGKFVLKSINGVSKKERIHVTLCKFI